MAIELDTDGPNWERRRLMSSHLSFDIKFLQPESINKIKKKKEISLYFIYWLSDLRGNINELSLKDGLVPGERIILSSKANSYLNSCLKYL
uniref:Uncharacterized protein n=1 Tax=Wuchereria bancrofti TaxID=6293 RepID=A0A1I8ETT6_WUCBA